MGNDGSVMTYENFIREWVKEATERAESIAPNEVAAIAAKDAAARTARIDAQQTWELLYEWDGQFRGVRDKKDP